MKPIKQKLTLTVIAAFVLCALQVRASESMAEAVAKYDKVAAGVGPVLGLDSIVHKLFSDGRLSSEELSTVHQVIDEYGYDQAWEIFTSDVKVVAWLNATKHGDWIKEAEKNRESVQWEPANTMLELAIRFGVDIGL